jgi:hypothetical protein
MGADMERYRLFILIGGLVAEEREFPATDDAVAEKLALGWRNNRNAAELWCGNRQVRGWRQGTVG